MNELAAILTIGVLLSIWATAFYSRRSYEELVKLNKKLDDVIDNQKR